jgi:acyl-CoA thioester hydrolase
MEVDAQGVVFNAWYLTYFDEAFTAFLAARGLPYRQWLEAGFDHQLVYFEARRNGGELACSARTVYVVVATDGTGKREMPSMLANALGTPAPLRSIE